MKSKKTLELQFVKLGCQNYVKQDFHNIKQCLNKTVSPQPTTWGRVMHLLRQKGFPVLCGKSYYGLPSINPRHCNKSKAISPKAVSSRLDITLMLKSACSSRLMQYVLPASFCCTEAGERTQTNVMSQYTRIFLSWIAVARKFWEVQWSGIFYYTLSNIKGVNKYMLQCSVVDRWVQSDHILLIHLCPEMLPFGTKGHKSFWEDA
jgi:hypothetical protein